jgi:hypothetical protein
LVGARAVRAFWRAAVAACLASAVSRRGQADLMSTVAQPNPGGRGPKIFVGRHDRVAPRGIAFLLRAAPRGAPQTQPPMLVWSSQQRFGRSSPAPSAPVAPSEHGRTSSRRACLSAHVPRVLVAVPYGRSGGPQCRGSGRAADRADAARRSRSTACDSYFCSEEGARLVTDCPQTGAYALSGAFRPARPHRGWTRRPFMTTQTRLLLRGRDKDHVSFTRPIPAPDRRLRPWW